MRGKGCYPGISRRAKEQRPVLREYYGRDFPMFIFGLQLSSVPRLARWGNRLLRHNLVALSDAGIEVTNMPATEAQLRRRCPKGVAVSPVSAQNLLTFSAGVKSHQSRHISLTSSWRPCA
jgi:hypothetical protein